MRCTTKEAANMMLAAPFVMVLFDGIFRFRWLIGLFCTSVPEVTGVGHSGLHPKTGQNVFLQSYPDHKKTDQYQQIFHHVTSQWFLHRLLDNYSKLRVNTATLFGAPEKSPTTLPGL